MQFDFLCQSTRGVVHEPAMAASVMACSAKILSHSPNGWLAVMSRDQGLQTTRIRSQYSGQRYCPLVQYALATRSNKEFAQSGQTRPRTAKSCQIETIIDVAHTDRSKHEYPRDHPSTFPDHSEMAGTY
jgi:hypothetical protein